MTTDPYWLSERQADADAAALLRERAELQARRSWAAHTGRPGCQQRLGGEPDGLLCNRTDPHVTGHTFGDTHGSHLGEGDRHAKEPDHD